MALKTLRIVLIGLSLFLTQCKGNTSSSVVQADKIEISPNPVNLVAGGDPVQLLAVLTQSTGGTDSDATFIWESEDPSIVLVDPNGLVVGLKIGVTRITARTDTLSGSAILGVVSPNAGAATVTLSGTALYEDKIFDKKGFTGALEKKPIRNAIIELIAIDGFVTIATGATNAFGDYELSGNNASRRGGLYLRVLSTLDAAHPIDLEIRNNPDEEALLAVTSVGIDDSTSNPFITSSEVFAKTTGVGGGFNILDVFQDASAFVRNAAPCPEPNTQCSLPLLKAYWEPGGTRGTYYRTPENFIFICGGGESEECRSFDPDEYDDSVIIHEFGHFVLNTFSKDLSPGGLHSLTENDQDIRLSWSEGWANFFSSAVRNSPLYVDTSGGGVLISFSLEDFSTHPTSTLIDMAHFTTSEIAVSGVLWDSFDPVETVLENDPLTLSFRDILQVVIHFPSVSTTSSMETFWLSFRSIQGPHLDNFYTVTRNRAMRFEEDNFEGSETALVLNGTSKQRHTLFLDTAAPDEDIIPFTVKTGGAYTVSTSRLTNGADTFLTIKEQNGTPVKENDNASNFLYTKCTNNLLTGLSNCPRNGPTSLSSSTSFVWNGEDNASLNAHVKSSSAAPPSAGRFGSYEIGLSSP